MSINYCTITSSSVDSFCNPRRGLIFNSLVPILHPARPTGTGGGTPHTDKVMQAYLSRRSQEKWEPPQIPTELERVVVEATFLTLKGTDGQDIRPGMELVTVTDIQVDSAEVNVNIQDLRFNHAEP